MKGLIDSCFAHSDVYGPRVLAGQYDLLTSGPFSTGLEGFHAGGIGGVAPVSFTASSASAYVGSGAGSGVTTMNPDASSTSAVIPFSSSATAFPSSPAAALPPPAAPSPPSTAGTPVLEQHNPGLAILPEVWEDMIEPGRKLLTYLYGPTY